MSTHVAILSEGLPADLRPLSYNRSTWDLPFLGEPLLVSALAWLAKAGYGDIFLVDETPGQYLHALTRKLPKTARYCQKVDARPAARASGEALHLPRGTQRVLLLKPCAMLEPDVDALEQFHEETRSLATFALVRLDPSTLQWPYIPACRLDENGRILEVEKLRRADALGSTRLDNVLGVTAPTHKREYWAPRNIAILEVGLAASLPLQELVAPLAGLARALAEQKVAIHGRAMHGRWWSMSTPSQVFKANTEALAPAPPAATDVTIRQMMSRLKASRAHTGIAKPKGLIAAAAAAVERQEKYPGVDPSAMVADEAQLGQHVKVAKGTRILGHTVVGPGTVIGENVTVTRCVIGSRCQIDPRVTLENCLLGDQTALPPEIVLKHAVMASGEVHNLVRGLPMGGAFLDSQPVDELAVSTYWAESAPVAERTPGRAGLRVLGSSMENDVYLLSDGSRGFVLKRRLDRNTRPLVREYHVLRMLAATGAAPEPLALDLRPELPVAPCLVMSYVQGDRVREGGIDADLARRIGKMCARIHRLPVEPMLRELPELDGWGYRDLLSYVVEVLGEYRAFLEWRNQEGLEDDDLTRYILSLLEWATGMAEMENTHWRHGTPRALCHGDLREFNMLVPEPGKLVLLDWERCGVGDPAYDLGWFLALANLTREAEQALMDGYGEGPEGDSTFWDRARTYRVIDLIAWPVHLMGLAQKCRQHAKRMTARAPRLVREYEDDAYAALATALSSFAALSQKEDAASYTVESVRDMGVLFAPQG